MQGSNWCQAVRWGVHETINQAAVLRGGGLRGVLEVPKVGEVERRGGSNGGEGEGGDATVWRSEVDVDGVE